MAQSKCSLSFWRRRQYGEVSLAFPVRAIRWCCERLDEILEKFRRLTTPSRVFRAASPWTDVARTSRFTWSSNYAAHLMLGHAAAGTNLPMMPTL